MHPAVSGHYRFRTERVYLRRGTIRTKKSSANEQVKLAMMEPAALLHTLASLPDIDVCSAIFLAEPDNGLQWGLRLPPICTQR